MNAAVYPASRSYYQKVLPAIKSLLYHSKVEQVVLLIEDDEYPGYLPEPVVTLNAQKVFGQYLVPNGPNVTRAPHAYLSIARTIYAGPLWTMGYRRILSLDADTIIAQDVGDEPWTLDLDGCHVAGVPETKLSAELGRPYISAGVMLMDLDAIHRDGLDVVMLHKMNVKRYQWLEQDCINEHCRIKPLGPEWNVSRFTCGDKEWGGGVSAEGNVKILHYAYTFGWEHKPPVRMYRDMEWEEVMEKWNS